MLETIRKGLCGIPFGIMLLYAALNHDMGYGVKEYILLVAVTLFYILFRLAILERLGFGEAVATIASLVSAWGAMFFFIWMFEIFHGYDYKQSTSFTIAGLSGVVISLIIMLIHIIRVIISKSVEKRNLPVTEEESELVQSPFSEITGSTDAGATSIPDPALYREEPNQQPKGSKFMG